jgi:hypothetical protein
VHSHVHARTRACTTRACMHTRARSHARAHANARMLTFHTDKGLDTHRQGTEYTDVPGRGRATDVYRKGAHQGGDRPDVSRGKDLIPWVASYMSGNILLVGAVGLKTVCGKENYLRPHEGRYCQAPRQTMDSYIFTLEWPGRPLHSYVIHTGSLDRHLSLH